MPDIIDEFHEFSATFDAKKRQLVHRVLVADTQTPVSAYLKLAGDKPNCFLLESVEGGEVRGRFSVIGLEPDLIWRCRKGRQKLIEHHTMKTNLKQIVCHLLIVAGIDAAIRNA